MDRTIIWDKQGQVKVQIRGDRVFNSRGEEIGYFREGGIFDKNGRHIAWFSGGILRDQYGKVMGFSENVQSGQPHPELPREREGAPPGSLSARSDKPGLANPPGMPPIGGQPPLGAAWSEFDPEEYLDTN